MLEVHLTSRFVTVILFKKQINARDWSHLSKSVLDYVKSDFSRWTWNGDQADDMEKNSTVDIVSAGGDAIPTETSGRPLSEQVFATRISLQFNVLLKMITAKSIIYCANLNIPTNLMGTAKLPDWKTEGLSVWFYTRVVIWNRFRILFTSPLTPRTFWNIT